MLSICISIFVYCLYWLTHTQKQSTQESTFTLSPKKIAKFVVIDGDSHLTPMHDGKSSSMDLGMDVRSFYFGAAPIANS